MASVTVTDLATPESFNAEGYLMLNPDVAADVGADGARRHFDRHGVREGRRLVTVEFLEGRAARGRRKYERFSSLLDASEGADGAFRFVGQEDAMPVYYGGRPYDVQAYEVESANAGLGEFVRELEANPDKTYLDLGCGLRSLVFDNCLYLEVYPSLTADLIMEPACRYPVASGSLDGISCLAVLEHVERPWEVAGELHRMLKPGGMIFIDWPFLQPVHGYPSHFYNATRAGLANLFKDGFEPIVLDTLPNQTPDHALSWFLREWSASLTSEKARAKLMRASVKQLLDAPPGSPFWTELAEATPDKAKMTLACGNTLIARKL